MARTECPTVLPAQRLQQLWETLPDTERLPFVMALSEESASALLTHQLLRNIRAEDRKEPAHDDARR